MASASFHFSWNYGHALPCVLPPASQLRYHASAVVISRFSSTRTLLWGFLGIDERKKKQFNFVPKKNAPRCHFAKNNRDHVCHCRNEVFVLFLYPSHKTQPKAWKETSNASEPETMASTPQPFWMKQSKQKKRVCNWKTNVVIYTALVTFADVQLKLAVSTLQPVGRQLHHIEAETP